MAGPISPGAQERRAQLKLGNPGRDPTGRAWCPRPVTWLRVPRCRARIRPLGVAMAKAGRALWGWGKNMPGARKAPRMRYSAAGPGAGMLVCMRSAGSGRRAVRGAEHRGGG